MISNESNIDYRDRYEKAQGTITVLQQELAQLTTKRSTKKSKPATSAGFIKLQ